MSAPARVLLAGGRRLALGGAPLLMGIVNATPDSFSDAGELPDVEARAARARVLAAAGARVIDVGGESALGGRPPVPAEEEAARVVPVIARVAAELDVLISVDTYKPAVAAAAVAAGAHLVNDVSGLRDPALAELCAATGAGLVLMHTRVAPKRTLLDPAHYDDVVADVRGFLEERMAVALAAGLRPEQLVLDPGPDFAKTPAQTVAVLRRLPLLHALGRPLLLAVSRKDFLGAITGRGPRERGAATLAAVGWAAEAGAHLVRVHDVAAAADFLAVRDVLAGERMLAAGAGLAPERYPAAPLACPSHGSPSAAHNASGRRPPSSPKEPMSSVLDRDALEQSPLADLHMIANELGVDGFRRLRKGDLVAAIITRQSGGEAAAAPSPDGAETVIDPVPSAGEADAGDAADAVEPRAEPAPVEESRPRRGRRGRGRQDAGAEAGPEAEAELDAAVAGEASAVDPTEEDATTSGRRGRRGGRGRGRREDARDADDREERDAPDEDRVAEGVVELLGNGSAFIRLSPPETTDDDVYVSAAQVKRCELVSGDRIAGPVRAPRRSERFASLVRVDTINGRPADEVAEGTRFEDLPVAWPAERLALGSEDATLTAVEWLTPFGKGSRVLIAGAPRAGKTELARDIATALSGREGLELLVVLAGTRPEEVGDWSELSPVAAVSFAASPDAQAQAVEQAIEQGRRVAARGGDAVVVVDTLEWLPPQAARKALAAARNLAEGGSLTVIATGPVAFGGETTVIALDAQLTALRRFPALDLAGSGTLRPDALVGEAGAEAIARARAEASGE